MSPVTSPGRRRVRAVVSWCVRGLLSLSFGKVVLGAAMVWMAAALLTTGSGNSIQTDSASAGDGANVSTAAVELASYSGQGSDGTDDNSAFSVPRWGGIGHPQPVSSGVIPVSTGSHQNGYRVTASSDTSSGVSASVDFAAAPLPRVTAGAGQQKATTEKANTEKANTEKANTRSGSGSEQAMSPGGRTGSVSDFLMGLWDRLGSAWSGSGGASSAGGSSSGASSVEQWLEQWLEQWRGGRTRLDIVWCLGRDV